MKLDKTSMLVVFHNIKNYDSHVLCVEGYGKMEGWKMNVIPQTTKKYITTTGSFQVGEYIDREGKTVAINFKLKFIDCALFFPQTSLESLVYKLTPDDFAICKATCGTQVEVVYRRKGIFRYFDNWTNGRYGANGTDLRG